jgi:hypothetical protein
MYNFYVFVYQLEINYSQVLMAHACNPSYLGGRDQEDHGSRPAWAKSSQDPHLNQSKPGMMVHTGHPIFGETAWENHDLGWPGCKVRPYPKNN